MAQFSHLSLKNISHICSYIPTDASKKRIQSLILSHLDYCNSLPTNIPLKRVNLVLAKFLKCPKLLCSDIINHKYPPLFTHFKAHGSPVYLLNLHMCWMHSAIFQCKHRRAFWTGTLPLFTVYTVDPQAAGALTCRTGVSNGVFMISHVRTHFRNLARK